MNVTVNLQERTDQAMAMFGKGTAFGAELEPVTPKSAERYGYSNLEGGLIVTSVENEGIAAEGDLQVGDVIEAAGGQQINSVPQLTQIFAEAQRQQVPLRVVVRRGNTRILLVIR